MASGELLMTHFIVTTGIRPVSTCGDTRASAF